MQRVEECVSRLREGVQVRHRRTETLRPRNDGEIGEFDLEGHGAAGNLRALYAVPRIAGDARQLGRQAFGTVLVLVESLLRADRLVRAVGPHFAVVDSAANSPIPTARTAELGFERGQAPFPKVRAGKDAEPFHLLCRNGTHSMEASHR